ncbi:MAG: hypothetical protein V4473_02490 [Patescibacteria group bacterium]
MSLTKVTLNPNLKLEEKTMGNHEYCEECGESNFHYNRPCDPERKAKYQREIEQKKEREVRGKQAAVSALKKLKKLGYEGEIDQHGDIRISKYSLIK